MSNNINYSNNCIKKSAKMKNPSAISKLAFHYSIGYGVPKNMKKSIKLYKKAINMRHSAYCFT